MYYLYMALLLSLAYVVACWLYLGRKRESPSVWWKRPAQLLLAALPVIALCTVPYLQLAPQVQDKVFEEASFWSASPTDFLIPSPAHPILGAWASTHFEPMRSVESMIYVGAVALLLAGLAVVKRDSLPTGTVLVLASLGLVAALLALGTDLHWQAQRVTVPVPAVLQRWYPHPRVPIPLPGYLIFHLLPLYDRMRVWMRYGIWVNLCVSLLAGLGLAWLLRRVGRRLRPWVACGVLVLALVDFYPGQIPLTPLIRRGVDGWLAQQPGQGAVAEFPLERSTLPTLTYCTLIHNKPLITGFFAAGPTPQFRRIQPVLSAFPDRDSVELLRQLGVQWVIVDAQHFPAFQQRQAHMEALSLHPAFADERYYVYELD